MIEVPFWYVATNAVFFTLFAAFLGIAAVADKMPVGAFASSALIAWALYSWWLI